MDRKREQPFDRAIRELDRLIENVFRDWFEGGSSTSNPGPPPRAGTWPTRQLKRLLNLADERGEDYAYTLILHLWLTKHEIRIPHGIFLRDVFGPGTGPKPSKQKRKDGEKAWLRQVELIAAENKDYCEDQLARLIWNAAPSYKASQIARELFSRRYSGGPLKRDAARNYVSEAIALAKPDAKTFAEKYLFQAGSENPLDVLMSGRSLFK